MRVCECKFYDFPSYAPYKNIDAKIISPPATGANNISNQLRR